MFQHVVIVGCGLIGCSFALALRRAGFDGRISGWGSPESVQEAVRRGMISERERSFDEGHPCSGDLIYLAAPVMAILDFLQTKSGLLKPGSFVTDAGSTKVEICRTAQQHLPSAVDFLGGHPMAGSEKSGPEHARADLFEGAAYILTPDDRTSSERLAQMELLLREIGARPIRMDAAEHDRAVAYISHLPQYLSTALAAMLEHHPDARHWLSLAGEGFRDMTRLAASRFPLWRDITRTNRENIVHALDDYIQQLSSLRRAVAAEDLDAVAESFHRANRLLPSNQHGQSVESTFPSPGKMRPRQPDASES